jgi:hypothetical protein
MTDGRVLIAFDDGPLEPTPTWTRIDSPSSDFPDGFVSGYDTQNGRQTLLSVTGTGTGTVYINDHKEGLFDPRNSGSPYYQKLDGKQILLQLWDPVREVWEPQFRGTVDNASYDIDGSAVNSDGDPINASIQLDCVDAFDYLAGFGLTPGLAGDRPPAGGADGVWYAATTDEAFVRILQILDDANYPSPNDGIQSVIFSGNVALQTVKYDPDESALTALRDCADAEFPFISNLYVDRFGRVVFHGRYGRFDPEDLSAFAGSDRWDWHSWKGGDGKHIALDSDRAQIRVLSYDQGRINVVNVATCYPANMPPSQMPSQVYADTTSIADYGQHAAPPMSDLLTAQPINDNLNGHPTWTRYTETEKFAELLVKNQKDPRESVTALQVKTVDPSDARATAVWALLTQADVSDVINLAVGYPSGIGLTGGSPADDYFIEGRQVRVRPLDRDVYDYVELDLEVSPRAWSSDPHSVFPAWSPS